MACQDAWHVKFDADTLHLVVTETQRRLAAIVATDVVGYSRLMGADEIGTLALLRRHRTELIDLKISEHGGRIVKEMGMAYCWSFPPLLWP